MRERPNIASGQVAVGQDLLPFVILGLDPRIGQSMLSAEIELLAVLRDARLKAEHGEFGVRGRAPNLNEEN